MLDNFGDVIDCHQNFGEAGTIGRTLIALLAVIALPAMAQDGPKRVKTETIRETAPGLSVLYAIDEDGTVRIDWDAVETLAVSKADRNMLPIAQLMLAIRDRSWKPVR